MQKVKTTRVKRKKWEYRPAEKEAQEKESRRREMEGGGDRERMKERKSTKEVERWR